MQQRRPLGCFHVEQSPRSLSALYKGTFGVVHPNPHPGIWTSPLGPEQESSDPALPRLLRHCWRLKACRIWPQFSSSLREPRVTLTVAGKPISFLIDTGPLTLLCLPTPRKARVSQVSVMGVDSLKFTPRITKPLPCSLQDTPFSHSFILPKCPLLFLGRDLSKFKASIIIPSPPSVCFGGSLLFPQ